MATRPQPNTYADLLAMPEGPERHEIIGGELFVTASPTIRHQKVVVRLASLFLRFADEREGLVLPGPVDVYFTETDVVAPDVVFVGSDRLDRVEARRILGAPTIIVEVSSPTTGRTDIPRKLPLYERHDVPEYWFVDLDTDRIEVYTLEAEHYGTPGIFTTGETITSRVAPGLEVAVTAALDL